MPFSGATQNALELYEELNEQSLGAKPVVEKNPHLFDITVSQATVNSRDGETMRFERSRDLMIDLRLAPIDDSPVLRLLAIGRDGPAVEWTTSLDTAAHRNGGNYSAQLTGLHLREGVYKLRCQIEANQAEMSLPSRKRQASGIEGAASGKLATRYR